MVRTFLSGKVRITMSESYGLSHIGSIRTLLSGKVRLTVSESYEFPHIGGVKDFLNRKSAINNVPTL